MSQNTNISQFLNSVLADDLSTAKRQLTGIMETKLNKRVRDINTSLDEGIFDRMGARAAGAKANLGARASNFGTKVVGGVKAAGQALSGNFKGAAKSLSGAQQSTDKNSAVQAGAAAKLQSIKASVLKDIQSIFPAADPAAINNIAGAIDAVAQKSKVIGNHPKVVKNLIPAKQPVAKVKKI